jgi:hypothetical protein
MIVRSRVARPARKWTANVFFSRIAPAFQRCGESRLATMSVGVSGLNLLGAMCPVTAATQSHSVRRLFVIDRQAIRCIKLAYDRDVLDTWVRDTTEDKQGFIWLTSVTGLYRYKHYCHGPSHPKTDSFVHYRRDRGDTGVLSVIRSSEAVQNTTGVLKTCQVALSRDPYPEGHKGLPDRKVPDECG